MSEVKVDFPAAATGARLHLRDLDFVDLYMALYLDRPSYYQVAAQGTLNVLPKDLPPNYHEDIVGLRRHLEEVLQDRSDAGCSFDGVRFRASKVVTPKGETWVALRRIEEEAPSLDKLGFMLPVAQTLKTLGKREGLVLVCGGTGQGKSTTASAMLNDYLHRYGGVAVTIEDPVEYPLEGRHGEAGLCYQIEARDENQWEQHLKTALRWHPRYIFVGEVRSPAAANQVLRAANSGHLVITTMHSGSLEEGLEGLLHLSEQAIGGQAPLLLASGLTAVLYQTFLAHSIMTKLYVTDEHSLGDPVRHLIRERMIGQATTFVDQQMARQDYGQVFTLAKRRS